MFLQQIINICQTADQILLWELQVDILKNHTVPTWCPRILTGSVNDRFLPVRRCASVGTSCGPVSVCLSVCLSITNRCSIKTGGRIELVFWHVQYDTIREAILTCARKPTCVSLIYLMEPTTKKCKNRKSKSSQQICSEITVNSLGNPCSESWRRKRKGYGGKDLQKRKVLSLEWKSEWVMEYQVIVSMTVGR